MAKGGVVERRHVPGVHDRQPDAQPRERMRERPERPLDRAQPAGARGHPGPLRPSFPGRGGMVARPPPAVTFIREARAVRLGALISLLAPPLCWGCGAAARPGEPLCARCRAALRPGMADWI